MKIILHRSFQRQYNKLPLKIRKKFTERRDLFITDHLQPLLNNHALGGKYQNCRSINITGDYRAIYFLLDSDTAIFIAIGTHPELYG